MLYCSRFAFNYDGNNVDKQNPLPNKIPKEMGPLLQKLVDIGLVCEGKLPDQLTVNEYSPGFVILFYCKDFKNT